MEVLLMIKEHIKVYLATPYSYNGGKGLIAKIVQWWRYRRVTKIGAYWSAYGYNVFSPITLTHPFVKYQKDKAVSHNQWIEYDYEWLNMCDELWVVRARGWWDSKGVDREIEFALLKNMPIKYLYHNGNIITNQYHETRTN